MGDACNWILEKLNTLLQGMTTQDSLLWSNLSSIEGNLYGYAKLAQPYILAIGYTFLGLFFLLELWNISKHVEGFGGGPQMGVEMIFGLLVKLLLCKLIMDNSFILLEALYNKIASITGSVASGWAAAGTLSLQAESAVTDATFFTMVAVFLLALVVLLVVAVAWLISRIIIWLRFIEIYLYMIVAPIPLATLPSDEWGQIGKGFLKSFISLCLQGLLIYLILSLFPVVAGNVIASDTQIDTELTIINQLLTAAGMSVLLIVALFGSNRLANSIMGAA